MKRQVWMWLMLTAVIIALAAPAAYAQSATKLTANIPFEFMAGTATMPAGQYEVTFGYAPSAVSIGTADHHNMIALLVNPVAGGNLNAPAKMVFHRYGDRYFLAQVWTREARGVQLPKTKAEKDFIKSASAHTVETVAASAR